MATTELTEALVVVTPQQLDAITAMIGARNVDRAVVGENNVAAFWSEGPRIMAQIQEALPDAEKPRLKAWNELSPDTRETAVAMAAGTLDWTDDRTLNEDYIQSVLDNDPELRAALLHPVAIPLV